MAGRRIELAVGVVRLWGQHPVKLARAAFTVAEAAAGGFVLGVGAFHREIAERTYGARFAMPAVVMAEYLTVLRSLLDTGAVEFSGETVSCAAELDRPADPGRVLLGVAGGGPRMLAVAGAAADIVITNTRAVLVVDETGDLKKGAGPPGTGGHPRHTASRRPPALLIEDRPRSRDAC